MTAEQQQAQTLAHIIAVGENSSLLTALHVLARCSRPVPLAPDVDSMRSTASSVYGLGRSHLSRDSLLAAAWLGASLNASHP